MKMEQYKRVIPHGAGELCELIVTPVEGVKYYEPEFQLRGYGRTFEEAAANLGKNILEHKKRKFEEVARTADAAENALVSYIKRLQGT